MVYLKFLGSLPRFKCLLIPPLPCDGIRFTLSQLSMLAFLACSIRVSVYVSSWAVRHGANVLLQCGGGCLRVFPF